MRWGKALSYGVKFFIMSFAFTVVGALMLASALSIRVTTDSGGYVISLNLATLNNVGALMLAIIGLMVIIIGNIASFFKLLSDVMREGSDVREYLW